MAIKLILSDLDGVIRLFPSDRESELEKNLGIPRGIIAKHAFEKHLIEKAITGKISDEEWRQEIQKSLAFEIDQNVATKAVQGWSDFPGKIQKEVLEFLMSFKPKYELALLTNATSRLKFDLSQLGILGSFDRIFNSSEIGFAKPDPKIFDHVSKTMNLKPSEIFFIDDSPMYIDAAVKKGFQGHCFTKLSELRESLEKYTH